MKAALLLPLLLTGCASGWRTTWGLAWENADGTRVEATATFEESGKRPVRAARSTK